MKTWKCCIQLCQTQISCPKMSLMTLQILHKSCLLFPVGKATWILKSGSWDGSVVEDSRQNWISFFILFRFSLSVMPSYAKVKLNLFSIGKGPTTVLKSFKQIKSLSLLYLSTLLLLTCSFLKLLLGFLIPFKLKLLLPIQGWKWDFKDFYSTDWSIKNLSLQRDLYQLSIKLGRGQFSIPTTNLPCVSSLDLLNLPSKIPENPVYISVPFKFILKRSKFGSFLSSQFSCLSQNHGPTDWLQCSQLFQPKNVLIKSLLYL